MAKTHDLETTSAILGLCQLLPVFQKGLQLNSGSPLSTHLSLNPFHLDPPEVDLTFANLKRLLPT